MIARGFYLQLSITYDSKMQFFTYIYTYIFFCDLLSTDQIARTATRIPLGRRVGDWRV